MIIRRLITPALKLCVIGIIIGSIWHFSRAAATAVPLISADELAEQTAPEVPVHVGTITRKTFHRYLTVFGTVEPAPATTGSPPASATLSAPSRGPIAEVTAVEGHQIHRGQPLFSMDSRQADASIIQSRQGLAASQKILEQLKTAPRDDAVPRWRILQAQLDAAAAQSQLDNLLSQRSLLTVTSPLDGTITRLNIKPGEIADPGISAIEIVDLHHLVIAANIPGFYMTLIQIGQTAIADQHDAAASSTGTVNRIDNTVDPATGMGSADITLVPDTRFRPGQPVRVQIAVEERPDALAVPAQSIAKNSRGENAIAIVIRDGHWASLVPVHVGLREGDQIEIQGENLTPGQPIVTTGAYSLPDGSDIRVLKD